MYLKRGILSAVLGCATAFGGVPQARAEATSVGVPDKAACVAALDKAQASRAGRKLLEARASYVTCSHEACPDMVRDDCSKGLREVDEALPTLVLSASVDGRDATDAKVMLDGERLSGGLDGRAISVDPGPHVARFERPGSGPVEVKVVAREGEKNRLVTGTFVLLRAEAPLVKREGSSFPVVPVAFAATGALALGGAFLMHLDMTDRANELGNACAPRCSQSDRDALSDRLVLRNVSLGVGIGALVVAAVTYVVASSSSGARPPNPRGSFAAPLRSASSKR
jgi:hypothetical protein